MIMNNKQIIDWLIVHSLDSDQTNCVDEVNLYMKSLNKSHLTDFTDGMCEQTEGL